MDPKFVRIIAVAIVVGVVVAGVGVALYVRSLQSAGCGLKSKNPLIIDQAEDVTSFDPQTSASTPGWGAVQQIYQTLVMYNGSSYTNYSGVLAQNWSNSSDGFHWNFTLRAGVHFSNGDPFNAYVMWYSLYRLLALQGIDQYLLSENFWYPNVNYYSNASNVSASLSDLLHELNTFNFDSPSASEVAVMMAPNQSFQVLSPNEIEFNLGFGYNGAVPYTFFLAEISTPGAAAVDPTAINANPNTPGGPGIDGPADTYLATTSVGTGPYMLNSYNPSAGFTLTPDPNYWAKSLAQQEPWNNNLQPAKSTIQVVFQGVASVNVKDLETGSVAAASFAYLGPDTIHQLQGNSCVVVKNLGPVFSGAGGSWWVYMNQSVFPFNNISVRAAITHAINYNEVIASAFGGFAFQWVGPVAPGHPYYNPGNVAPYQYNAALAQQEIQNSPCANMQCKGLTFNFMYLDTGPDWADTATILQANLATIGITLNPLPITLQNFYNEQTIDPYTGQCETNTTMNGGPYYIGLDFYSSDYISPDDWTQQNVLSYGSANVCMSGYYNPAMDNLTLVAAGEHNAKNLTADYTLMTQTMYDNYTNAWLAVPTLFDAYNPAIAGLYPTPMGSTVFSTMDYNTVYAA